MPRVKKLDLGMTALDELFMNDKERAENKLPKIFDIPLSEIDDFPDHPYRVLDDEDMQNLMESIKDRGVITPAMVRKKDDSRYEMISGHKVIQNVLGHVDISTTMNIYIDVTNDLKKEEMLTYAKFVGNSKGKIETAV